LTNPAEHTVRVTDLSHDGRGVAHLDGKAVFIDDALPGDTVRFRHRRKRRAWDQGELLEILEPAPERVDPPCPAFGRCGGCALQHLDPQAALERKHQGLLNELRLKARVNPEQVDAPVSGPLWNYRRRARLGARYVPRKGGVLVGFRERRHAYIADMLECRVLPQHISDQLPALRELLGSLARPDRIPQIEVAVADAQSALVFRNLDPLGAEDQQRLREYSLQSGMQVFLQPGNLESVTPLEPVNPPPLVYSLPRHQVEIHFRPTDFIQVNAEINSAIVDRVVEVLAPAPEERVVDFFCGLGNLTLPLARRAAFVHGLEWLPGLVARARQNAAHNDIENVSFDACDLEQGPPKDMDLSGFTKWLVDPPRTGALAVVQALEKSRPERLVYLSCNPATLARDAGMLVHQFGYRMTRVGVFDMFPHTTHVESLAVFDKDPGHE
jgi:23S rRNA (uracil1939-C5)-methyltransferase